MAEESIYQANLDEIISFLENILQKHASSDALMWLKNKQDQVVNEKNNTVLFTTFSSIPTYFDKKELELTEEELEKANQLRPHWNPNHWSISQFARTYLILIPARYKLEQFTTIMNKIFNAADVHELMTLYQALPLYPYPQKFLLTATNGIRSNMLSVFESIALNNPYPADYFNEVAWNQLVLKVFFVGSHIEEVIGVPNRVNAELTKALINTVRERLSADRPVQSGVWWLIGLSLDKESWKLLKNFAEENKENPVIKEGCLIVCEHSALPEAKEYLAANKDRGKTPEKTSKFF